MADILQPKYATPMTHINSTGNNKANSTEAKAHRKYPSIDVTKMTQCLKCKNYVDLRNEDGWSDERISEYFVMNNINKGRFPYKCNYCTSSDEQIAILTSNVQAQFEAQFDFYKAQFDYYKNKLDSVQKELTSVLKTQNELRQLNKSLNERIAISTAVLPQVQIQNVTSKTELSPLTEVEKQGLTSENKEISSSKKCLSKN